MRHCIKTLITLSFLLFIAGLLSLYTSTYMNKVYPVIKIGVSPGPQTEIMEFVKETAKKQNLNIRVIVYDDYIKLNEALAHGEIDINSFQQQPYLEHMISSHQYAFTPIAKTFISPMGLYSVKYKNIADIPVNATALIPNDPINMSRALFLFAKAGLIDLKPTIGNIATTNDIINNPQKLNFKEVEVSKIGTLLPTADITAINTYYALAIKLTPDKDALALEDATSPYVNILAIRTTDKDNQFIQKFVQAYCSPEVKQYIQEHYNHSIITAF